MATFVTTQKDKNLLHRLFGPIGNQLTVPAAKSLLNIRFSESDHARMEFLCTKGRHGKLTPAEQEEFDEFERVGSLLDLLHSKARLTLKRRASASKS